MLLAASYQQVLDPVADSFGLSSIFAVLPLLTLFVLLGGFKLKAWIAGLASLAVALAVAIVVYGMPVSQTLLSASEGATFGFFPILWVVINAIWVYNLTVATDGTELAHVTVVGAPSSIAVNGTVGYPESVSAARTNSGLTSKTLLNSVILYASAVHPTMVTARRRPVSPTAFRSFMWKDLHENVVPLAAIVMDPARGGE